MTFTYEYFVEKLNSKIKSTLFGGILFISSMESPQIHIVPFHFIESR